MSKKVRSRVMRDDSLGRLWFCVEIRSSVAYLFHSDFKRELFVKLHRKSPTASVDILQVPTRKTPSKTL